MPPLSDPVLEKLATALEDLGLQRARSLDEIRTVPRKSKKARLAAAFIVAPRLRFARHFDLPVGLLVYDPELGTLGLIQRLVAEDSGLVAEVQRRIDQATYVRHLLLTAPDLGRRLPLTVELVLLGRDEPGSLRHIGQSLGRVARETQFLEAVGVNLLLPSAAGETFSRKALRRAFPWLLQATAAWYAARPPAGTNGQARRLAAVELENYRLPGPRRLTLERSPVHLVFGRNGSGKSSLVEALELVVTGKVDRLPGDTDYAQVIRNRGAAEPARVRLHFTSGKSRKIEDAGPPFEVGSTGISSPLSRDLRATAFRLDQTVMDKLTRFGDAQRAEVFLRSFFAAESSEFLTYQRAREEAEKALGDLPAALREQLTASRQEGEDPEAGVLRQLAWLGEEQGCLPPAIAAACLPLPATTIAALGILSPELAQLTATWSQEPPAVSDAAATLGRIDEILERLRGSLPATLETLSAARSGLQQVDGWQATGGSEAGRNFLADLNEWLRRCALASLAEQYCQLLETLAAARQAGWFPEPGTLGPFGQAPTGPAELAAQRKQAADWTRERDDLLQRVTASASTAEGGAGKPSSARALPSRRQREQMDAASRWLVPAPMDSSRPLLLGQALEQAFTSDRTVPVGDVTIGTADWAKPLLDRLERLDAACRALRDTALPGGRIFQALGEVRTRYQALHGAGAKVGQSFLRQLRGEGAAPGSSLVEALNELMALFTPARWAYEDIDLKYRGGSAGGEELSFQIDERVQAALSLNTAQLNLFTVALFLLCAVQTDNPLGLLILDDPLQNMDELTVTTLARGLAKVSRLWKEPWQLLLFFHGQEDRDRFYREVPLAVYELPWLSPEDGPATKEPVRIPVTHPLYSDDLQTLGEIADILDSVAPSV